MITREEAKMFFDSDTEVLKQAFESDKEYANIIQTTISVYVSAIFGVLIEKGIITEEDSLKHLTQASEIMREEIEKNKENSEVKYE